MARVHWNRVIRQVDRLCVEGTSTGWSDSQLLSRFAGARDEAELAFEVIVQRHGPMVLEVCRRLLKGDHHAAEDAFQATFLVLARRASMVALRPTGSLGPWLHEVACRTAGKARVTTFRREMREQRAADLRATTFEDGDKAGDDDEYRVLHEEIARLPEKYRSAVVVCYFEGLTHDEAARLLRWPVGTVRGYLARARDLLRARLIRRGVAPAVAAMILGSRAIACAAVVAPELICGVSHAVSRGSEKAAVTALAATILRALLITRIQRVALVFCAMAIVGTTGLAVSNLRFSGVTRQGRNSRVGGREEGRASLPDGAIKRLGELRFNHGGEIKGVGFALGGKALLSAGGNGIIRVWDVKSGEERYAIAKGGLQFYCSALSSDGTSLVTFGGDGIFRLWELETGRELRHWEPLEAKAFFDCMALSPDGKTIATAGLNDKAASLWAVGHPGKPRRLEGDERSIWDVAFSPDGRILATAALEGIPQGFATNVTARPDEDRERGSVRLWDVDKGVEIRRFPVNGYHPRCVAFSCDGATLAVGFSDATIRLYHSTTGTERARLKVQGPLQGCLAFSPDGGILASGAHPYTAEGGVAASIHLWDVARAREIRQFAAHDMYVSELSFSPDGRMLASGGGDNAIRLWEASTGREIGPSVSNRSGVTCLVVSPADGTVITGGYDKTIRQWDPATGHQLRQIDELNGPVHDLAISSDGRLLLSGGLDGTVRLRDRSTGKTSELLGDAPRHGRRAGGLAFTSDGETMTAAGRVLDVKTGREIAFLQSEKGGNFVPWASGSVFFTPDGMSIISWSNRDICLWETTAGKIVRRIIAPQAIFSMAVEPDGRFIAAGLREDHSIRLWHLASGREVAKLDGPADVSPTIAFSADGRLLATGCGDYTKSTDRSVRLWELASGCEVRRFEGHRSGVTRVAFLLDGRSLVSSSADGTVVIWDVTGLGRDRLPAAKAVPAADLEALWIKLAGEDAPKAHRAIWAMTAAADRAVPFLSERLKPIRGDDPNKDTSLGPIASGETLRRLRAIAVLEKAGTAEAQRVLERMESGIEGARETRDAKSSLRRMARE